MTWQITISGHNNEVTVGSEEQTAHEEDLANRAAAFVATLEDDGVRVAKLDGNMVHRNLMPATADV